MAFIAKQIPYVLHWDKMPIDISHVFKNEKPAGKHGFLKVKGEEFVFEDGTPVRFWGTNLNSAANFPEHDYAEKLAKRLSAAGLNMVRLHQLDAEWSTPNIFQFTKGELLKDTRHLDPDSMDRLDYLVAQLKKEGIYIYMDFLTYRKFRTGDGIENALNLREGGKPYSNFSRKLIALQKEFITNFMEHKNPYTGLCYKDEPALCLAEIFNESDMFTDVLKQTFNDEPWRSELLEMYHAYADKKGVTVTNENFEEKDPFMSEFCIKLLRDYYHEMHAHIRSVGGKFPITGTNYPKGKQLPYSMREMDFLDSHAYWWHGATLEGEEIQSVPHTKNKFLMTNYLVYNAVNGKPLFCSEWDTEWPNEYRADSPILMAAIGALQGWSGYTIHTYRYLNDTRESVTDVLGRIISYGGSYYRGSFDTYNDPAKFGLFYHAALITRRGDVKRANETVIIGMSDEEIMNTDKGAAFDKVGTTIAEKHKVCFDYNVESRGDSTYSETKVLSDTGEIYRDSEKGFGYVDTPLTKAVYGFTGAEGKIDLNGVSVEVKNRYGTVALSSLTDAPITESDNILLTTVGKAENSGTVFSDDRKVYLKHGTAPVMIDVIEGEIAIKTERKTLRVWSVDSHGFFTGALPSEYKNGVFKFKIGEAYPSMYYLIQDI